MRLDPNEDLEEQVERGNRERDGEQLIPIATKAGWFSLWTSCTGIIFGGTFLIIMWNGPDHWIFAYMALLLLAGGQCATLMDYGVISYMKFVGIEASVRKPLLLGLPGALVSGTLSAYILYRLLA